MINVGVNLAGNTQISTKLHRLSDINALLNRPLRDATSLLARDLAHYPPLGRANMPPASYGRWYVRGSGLFYKSISGGIRLLRRSERLGVSWKTSYTFKPELARGKITTRVSYAPVVHGTHKQAYFHAKRGWRTVQTLFEQRKGIVINMIGGAIRSAMAHK